MPSAKAHAGQRAELRVAALDQLPEQRRVQPRRRGTSAHCAANWLAWQASAARLCS